MSFEKVPNFLANLSEADMKSGKMRSYEFCSFRLDVEERQLFHGGRAIPLTPKAFDVLAYLVAHSGHLVLKDDLMQAVWPDSFVDEVNLPRLIHTLRKALGEDDNGHKFIETVPTKGYRFVATAVTYPLIGEHIKPQNSGSLSVDIAELSQAEIDVDDKIGGLDRRRRKIAHSPRMVLISATAFIVAVSVLGFWFSDRSRPPRSGFGALFPQTRNAEAYGVYQQGRLLIEQGSQGDLQGALANFEKAVELDPNYADAYAGIADAKIQIFWPTKKHDPIVQARNAITKALELDQTSAYAHTQSCRIKATYDWDFQGAEKECRLAIELEPNFHDSRRELAFLLANSGRDEEAMREMDFAVALAPTLFNKRTRGLILYCTRHYDEAIAQLREVQEADQDGFDATKWLSYAFEMKGDYENALEAKVRFVGYNQSRPEEAAALRAAFNTGGWPAVLRRSIDPKNLNMAAAAAYAQLGEADAAIELLNKLTDAHAVLMVETGREPQFDPIRSDPRFNEILKRVGLR